MTALDGDRRPDEKARPGVVVFVHGIFGGQQTWSELLPKLRENGYINRFFDLELFTYASPKVLFNPLKRIPEFKDVASELAVHLQERFSERSCVVLVGHSQGGLIIQRFLVDAVRAGRASEDLSHIRGVVLLATPNGGSELFLSARRMIGPLWGHAQERNLRPFNEEIAEIHSQLLKHIVYAQHATSNSRPIRFDVYTGDSDGVVPAHSARGLFPNTGTLPGDHSSIVRPKKSDDLVVRTLAAAFRRAFNALVPDTTILRTQILDPRNLADVLAAEALFGENFVASQNVTPEDFRHWLTNYEEKFGFPMRVILARVDEQIHGLLMFHESHADGLAVIDYVACRRESGLQSRLFAMLLKQLRARIASTGISSVVFEVEDPSTRHGSAADRARARVRRFEALGARTIGGLRYLAPDMQEIGPAGEESFLLMHVSSSRSPPTLRRSHVQRIVRFLYLTWYRNWFSHRFNGREAELQEYVEGLYQRVAGDASRLPEVFPLEGPPLREGSGL